MPPQWLREIHLPKSLGERALTHIAGSLRDELVHGGIVVSQHVGVSGEGSDRRFSVEGLAVAALTSGRGQGAQ
ncbi:MAG: hypothetical protein M3065_10785, partial [Actinomycetota bacterium]|nr:hypothetical protein [Actinomycetota bacterium]